MRSFSPATFAGSFENRKTKAQQKAPALTARYGADPAAAAIETVRRHPADFRRLLTRVAERLGADEIALTATAGGAEIRIRAQPGDTPPALAARLAAVAKVAPGEVEDEAIRQIHGLKVGAPGSRWRPGHLTAAADDTSASQREALGEGVSLFVSVAAAILPGLIASTREQTLQNSDKPAHDIADKKKAGELLPGEVPAPNVDVSPDYHKENPGPIADFAGKVKDNAKEIGLAVAGFAAAFFVVKSL